MRAMIVGLLAMALAACAPAPRDVRLAGLDLGNPRTLAALQQNVPVDERAALATYALLHWPQSKFYCGEPIGGSQPLPQTVGEAIDQTRAYEAALETGKAREGTPVRSAAQARDKTLVDRIDYLVLKRDMLRMSPGTPPDPAAPSLPAIERELATLRSELAEARR